MSKEIFAANLKELRKRAGWTQQDFADALGVKRYSVGSWEEQRAWPEIDKLILICDCFGGLDMRRLIETPIQ